MTHDDVRQPVIYVPHGGGPWPWMDDPAGQWDELRASLAELPSLFPEPPTTLVVVTAHWEAPTFRVATSPAPPMVYDYGGFPAHTYAVTYRAPGEPSVGRRIVELATAAGIDCVADTERGFDHGVFVPLAVAFPDADVPVVSVSLRTGLDAAAHVAFGRALAPLRDEGALIIGSGLSVHDLSFRVTRDAAESFHSWLDESMERPPAERRDRLASWESAPGARACHPREEHLLPLMVAAGAAGDDVARRVCSVDMFGLPATGYLFGDV